MLKKTNKQTKQTQESHTKNSISSGLGKKESYPNQITYIPSPPPAPSLLPLKSQMVDPYSVRIQSHVQALKQEEQDVLWRKTTTTTRTS